MQKTWRKGYKITATTKNDAKQGYSRFHRESKEENLRATNLKDNGNK